MKAGRHNVEISNSDKILFGKSGITKEELAKYYRDISDIMLPYVQNRPISMKRYPNGIDEEGFYQKEAPDYFPDFVKRVRVSVEDGSQLQVACNNTETLVYLADQACITPHIWLSKEDKLNYPDRLIFDLDPPKGDFTQVRESALILKDILDELKLNSFVMTTGSKGLHLIIPLDRSQKYEDVRSFARDFGDKVVEFEDGFTMEQRKNKRGNRVFIDYLRNAYGQTSVPPYSVRARENAPVATPFHWDELNDKEINSQSYNIKNIFRRLSQKDDPWKGIGRRGQSIKKAKKRLERLN